MEIRKYDNGTAQPNLSAGDLQKFLFPLPPLAEQKRIVAKVDSIFVLIDQLAQQYTAEQAERANLVASSLARLSGGRTTAEQNLALEHLTSIIRTRSDAKVLRQTILHLAVSGQLVPQNPSDGTGEDLYQQIQTEKKKLVAQGKLKKQKTLPEITDDETPFEIPESWKWARLGNATTYQQRGKSPKYAIKSDYSVISQRCVRTDKIDWSVAKFIKPESIRSYESFRFLQDGDLLLNSTGTGTMGRVGIFSKNEQYAKAVADSHVTVVRNPENLDSKFVHTWLNSPSIQKDVESKASGSTNQIEWNLASIQNELLPLPPLAEQKRIAAKTTQLLDLVSELETHLEEIK